MPMPLDPRTPVIVGVGQVTRHDGEADPDLTAVEMMIAAVAGATADAGVGDLPTRATVWIASAGVFRFPDPAAHVAAHFGASEPTTFVTNFGGNLPQAAVAHLCAEVAAGRLDCGVVMGGEVERNRRLLKAEGLTLDNVGADMAPAEKFGSTSPIPGEAELSVGAGTPAVAYALFESALRAAAGRSLPEHEAHLGRLWAAFSEVGAANPYGWARQPLDAEAIVEATPENRMVAYPYTKAMCANPQVDMGAAVIVMSVAEAIAAGVDRDRMVFPLSSATGHDTVELLQRRRFDRVPAIAPTAQAALDAAGVDIEQVGPVDLYACFPSIVQISADAMGLGLDRALTVTGGLGFGGGPLNNATLHAVASMVERLRHDGGVGLVHGNGGVATKHSMGIYGREPATKPFADVDAQPMIDLDPCTPEPTHVGSGTIDAITVIHERSGPEAALAVLGTEGGGRAFARSSDADLMAQAASEELVGQTAERRADGSFVLA